MMPTIRLNHIKHRFEKRHKNGRNYVLDDLSLTIFDGETLSVVGPSGCGKTTLLRIIAGLIEPDEGTVLYDGQTLNELPMSERGIGMVFQNRALFSNMTVHDNIGFFDIIRRQREKIPARIQHVADEMNIEVRHLLSRKPPTLSGGEAQKVAIARCLAREPALFLFDEPLANLDAQFRNELRFKMKRLIEHYKITTVYVTHDLEEAAFISNRIAIMNEGRMQQAGTYQQLYQLPRTIFVAEFFGAMNLFEGFIRDDGVWQGVAFEVPMQDMTIERETWVVLGIHAEHIKLINGDGVPAQVELVEPRFAQQQSLVYVRIGKEQGMLKVPLSTDIRAGDTVHLAFPPEAISLFDRESGLRIN
jgi:ABC-type sugar transport system ATPase subunit